MQVFENKYLDIESPMPGHVTVTLAAIISRQVTIISEKSRMQDYSYGVVQVNTISNTATE